MNDSKRKETDVLEESACLYIFIYGVGELAAGQLCRRLGWDLPGGVYILFIGFYGIKGVAPYFSKFSVHLKSTLRKSQFQISAKFTGFLL